MSAWCQLEFNLSWAIACYRLNRSGENMEERAGNHSNKHRHVVTCEKGNAKEIIKEILENWNRSSEQTNG